MGDMIFDEDLVFSIDATTELYCVYGNPVVHSLSPYIHNLSFRRLGINAVYLAFEIDNIEAGIYAVKTLNIKGVSITIPYKEIVMDYIDDIDEEAENIGAVNTLVNIDGFIKGYNTDGIGAIMSIKEKISPENKKVVIIGSGGTTKTLGYSLLKEGISSLTIVARNEDKSKKLIDFFSKSFSTPMDFVNLYDESNLKKLMEDSDIIINTTPVGMFPNEGESPIPENCFLKGKVYMDVIYNPRKTAFIKQAEKASADTITGDDMFLYQAVLQEKLWLDVLPDVEYLRGKLKKILG